MRHFVVVRELVDITHENGGDVFDLGGGGYVGCVFSYGKEGVYQSAVLGLKLVAVIVH